jgi:hypothetical protein
LSGEGGFVIAFEVWVEIVAKGGRGNVEEAEPAGEGGGPIGVWKKGCEDGGGVGVGTGVAVGAVVVVL